MTTALFLLDALLDALALALAARLGGRRLRPVRAAAGALLGAVAAHAARRLPEGCPTAVLWMPAAVAMMAAAFGRDAFLRPLRSAALLFCAEGILGGMVLSLYGATQSLSAAYALGALCTAWIAVTALRVRSAALNVTRVCVRCRAGDCEVVFTAIVDSGNTLRDYLTHRPVIVMPQQMGRRYFPSVPLRPIFADTAGGRQMMLCFVPEETEIRADGAACRTKAAVALSPGMRADAPALVPCALLGDERWT